MLGLLPATGIRILAKVNFKGNRNILLIAAISIGTGMIPLIVPKHLQWMPHGIHPLTGSGILLASMSAVLFILFFTGGKGDASAAIDPARQAGAH